MDNWKRKIIIKVDQTHKMYKIMKKRMKVVVHVLRVLWLQLCFIIENLSSKSSMGEYEFVEERNLLFLKQKSLTTNHLLYVT